MLPAGRTGKRAAADVAAEADQSPTTYARLRAAIAAAAGGATRIAEPPSGSGGAPRVDEKLVQAIWHEQLLHGDRLETCSRRPLRVIEPGRWNHGAGPDFRNAEIEVGGRRMRGDVEIHVESADWDRHRHARDFEYNHVVLHAFLHRTDPASFDQLHNGSKVERLELAPFVNPDPETVLRSLQAEDYVQPEPAGSGRCRLVLASLDPDLVGRFLASAARQRMEEKIRRIDAQLRTDTPDQVLYQGLMTALGHKGTKTLFFLLARRTPVEELKVFLRDAAPTALPDALEAVMLNVANLLPAASAPDGGPCSGSPMDAETLAYLDAVHGWWTRLAGYYEDRLMPPTRRWHSGVRPVSFPSRRVAGMARVLARLDFRSGLLDACMAQLRKAMTDAPRTARDFRRVMLAIQSLFEPAGQSYWARRYTLGGTPTPAPINLIGADRAASLTFNVLLPMAILRARADGDAPLEAFLWRLFENFPALGENSLTRHMRQRLFGGGNGSQWMNPRTEKAAQALLHIFHDCCANNALTCDDCALLRQT